MNPTRLGAVASLALACTAATGCTSAMSNDAAATAAYTEPTGATFRFRAHNFDAHCYNTQDCSVVYDNASQAKFAAGKKMPPPPAGDYRSEWMAASYIVAKDGFPSPAEVRWTSLDGSTHEASVDLAAIFKDRTVLHQVPAGEIPPGAAVANPDIILEVNDRTINVYMRALVPTKTEQVPGNRYSFNRTDVIRAWTHTY